MHINEHYKLQRKYTGLSKDASFHPQSPQITYRSGFQANKETNIHYKKHTKLKKYI